MHRLAVLTQIVEAREGLLTVALKRTLARMLADVASEVLAAGEHHAAVAKPATLEHDRAASRDRGIALFV